MPTFLSNKPQATDQLSISQGDLLNNFSILGAIAGNTNASSASINATSGFNWIYLPDNGSIPPVGSAFPAGALALYGNANATTTLNELYINKKTASTTSSGLKQIPATAMKQVSATQGWCYWPSGMLVKWGQRTFTANTDDVSIQTDFASPLYDVTNTGLTSGAYFVTVNTVYTVSGNSAHDFDTTAYFQGFNVSGAATFRVHKQGSNSCTYNYMIFGLGA